jgi:hypothetical protein
MTQDSRPKWQGLFDSERQVTEMAANRFVQFLHPGREHGPDHTLNGSTGWKDWNRGEHKRKFMLAEGSYALDPRHTPVRGSFTFWGEWEPSSEVRLLDRSTPDHHPCWLHIPHLMLDGIEGQQKQAFTPCAPGGPQNTDPLVFGDRFRYVLCQQFKGNPPRATQLAKLEEGEIILFGSCVGGAFAVDTVFVVGTYAPVQRHRPLPDWESDLHRKITMDLTDIPSCGLRLYGGQTWSPDMPFSFVPCLPMDDVARGFKRPVIKPLGILSAIISPELKQGHKIEPLKDPKRAQAARDAVVRQVLSQGCALGTSVDEPAELR